MPNCFSLTRKCDITATSTPGPVALQKIDDEMREHFKAPPSDSEWFGGWYNAVGFRLALGMSFEQILEDARERYPNGSQGIEIVEWLQEHFVADAWAER
jgi:hypothetical protein